MSEPALKPVAAALLGLSLLAAPAFAQGPAAQTLPPIGRPGETAQAFMARNGADPAVKTLPSGLQYRVLKSGPAGGAAPKPGDAIKVNYEGSLVSGQVFDSTFARGKPALMFLEDLIPSWMEALPLMHVGDEWTLYVPPELGYGQRGAGPIPPGSVLVFRLQLLGTLSAD
jgi:peptidylprolyl isomerase/FKBP-type peptidyl-prolyl cis-trans isomerase FklB